MTNTTINSIAIVLLGLSVLLLSIGCIIHYRWHKRTGGPR